MIMTTLSIILIQSAAIVVLCIMLWYELEKVKSVLDGLHEKIHTLSKKLKVDMYE